VGCCGPEVEANVSTIVPRLANGVVQDDERSAWSERMAEEVVWLSVDAAVRGYIGLVGKCAHHVQGALGLRKEFIPEVDGE
jgi:hypothetical protein